MNITLGEIYNAALPTVKKYGISMFLFVLVMRVLVIIAAFSITFAMFVYMETTTTMDGAWTSMYSTSIAVAVSAFCAIMFDAFVTAYIAIKQVRKKALSAFIKRLPKLILASLIAVAMYFVVFIAGYVFFGIVVMSFHPVQIAAYAATDTLRNLLIAIVFVCGLLMLVVNMIVNMMMPLIARDVPFMLSLDSAFSYVLKPRFLWKLKLLSILGKIVTIGFYVVIYAVVNTAQEWNFGSANPPMEANLTMAFCFAFVFFAATFMVPLRKSVVCKMAAVTGEINLHDGLQEEQTNALSKRVTTAVAEVVVKIVVLGGLVWFVMMALSHIPYSHFAADNELLAVLTIVLIGVLIIAPAVWLHLPKHEGHKYGKPFGVAAIDGMFIAMVLGLAFYGLIFMLSQNNPEFIFTLSFGIAPMLVAVAMFAAAIAALNVVIQKFLKGRYLGHLVMRVSLDKPVARGAVSQNKPKGKSESKPKTKGSSEIKDGVAWKE